MCKLQKQRTNVLVKDSTFFEFSSVHSLTYLPYHEREIFFFKEGQESVNFEEGTARVRVMGITGIAPTLAPPLKGPLLFC